MLIHVAIGVCQRMWSVPILPALMFPFIGHEAIRVLLQLGANVRMSIEVAVEALMVRPKLWIVHEVWIMRELTRNFRMLIQIAVVEARYLAAGDAGIGRRILRHGDRK